MEKQNIQHSINRSESVIIIRDLYKSFEDLDVLKGVNLNVFKGENVAVLGKSGSGKSVLIKIIIGLLKPDQGEVIVLGQHVDELQEKEFAAADRGFTAVKHQREVGTGYFDSVTQTIQAGTSSTTALKGSTEEEQFTQAA